jgi:transposase-like protein
MGDNSKERRNYSSEFKAGSGLPPFPGHGRPRDEELTRLRKENKVLREANEILKKAAEL